MFSVDRYFTFHTHPLELGKSNDNTSLSPLDSVATNFPLMCTSLETFICNLPDSGRHVTRPNQGLSSLAAGEGKRKALGTRLLLVMKTSWTSSRCVSRQISLSKPRKTCRVTRFEFSGCVDSYEQLFDEFYASELFERTRAWTARDSQLWTLPD